MYVDDCLYSGNRLRNEVEDILYSNHIETARKLIIWYPVMHSDGWEDAKSCLKKLLKPYVLRYHLIPPVKWIINAKSKSSKVECFWPINDEDSAVKEYLQRIQIVKRGELFRPSGTPKEEKAFSSRQGRDVVEKLFLRVGIELMSDPNIHRHMRPLGFDFNDPLGFGSLFISHRNIANNCPMALWFESKKPGSEWFPLLRRKHNFEDKNWS